MYDEIRVSNQPASLFVLLLIRSRLRAALRSLSLRIILFLRTRWYLISLRIRATILTDKYDNISRMDVFASAFTLRCGLLVQSFKFAMVAYLDLRLVTYQRVQYLLFSTVVVLCLLTLVLLLRFYWR